MGLIFDVRPSLWEVKHSRPIFQAKVFQSLNDGNLPDTPMWSRLISRFDQNQERFTHWHPNVARLILRSREEIILCSPQAYMPPMTIPNLPVAPLVPVPVPSLPTVAEPPSVSLLAIPLLLTYFLRRMF